MIYLIIRCTYAERPCNVTIQRKQNEMVCERFAWRRQPHGDLFVIRLSNVRWVQNANSRIKVGFDIGK